MEVAKPSAERFYLENVLGVRAFLSPQDWHNTGALNELASPEMGPFVSVISAKVLSPAAHELLAKMLAAISIQQFVVSNDIDLSIDPVAASKAHAVAFIFLGDETKGAANQLSRNNEVLFLHLPELEILVVDPDSFETKSLKMKIWQELKQFKNALDKIK